MKEDQSCWSSAEERKIVKKDITEAAENHRSDYSKVLRLVKTGKLWSHQWFFIHQKWKLVYNYVGKTEQSQTINCH